MNFNDRFYRPFFSLTTDGNSPPQQLLLSVLIPIDKIGKKLVLISEPTPEIKDGILYVDFHFKSGSPSQEFIVRDFTIDLNPGPDSRCIILRVWDHTGGPMQLLGSGVAYCDYADPNPKNLFTPYLHVFVVPETGIYSVGLHIPLRPDDNYLIQKIQDNRLTTDQSTQYFVREFEIAYKTTTTHVPYIFEELNFQKIDKDFEMWIEVNSTINGQGSKGTVAHGDADEKPGPEIFR